MLSVKHEVQDTKREICDTRGERHETGYTRHKMRDALISDGNSLIGETNLTNSSGLGYLFGFSEANLTAHEECLIASEVCLIKE